MIIPVIKERFSILAPITFPKLNAELFERAEEIPTKSSGRDVARAMIMKAAENSEMCKKRAIFPRDLTRKYPLTIKTAQDNAKYIIVSIIFFFLYFIKEERVFIFNCIF